MATAALLLVFAIPAEADAKDRPRPKAAAPADAEASFSAGFADDSAMPGGIDTAIWRPADSSSGPAPLVVFSHGYRGCNTQSAFLMRALANGGYLVLSPNHADSNCGPGAKSWRGTERPFGKPKLWDESTYRGRREDVAKLVAALKSGAEWQGRIDWSRVALAGHSLGGYTALGLAGAWPQWRIDGLEVKAVLALSPYVEPFTFAGTLKQVKLPIMFQGGSKDYLTPTTSRPGGAYEQAGGKTVYVELDKAGHFAWTDRLAAHHDVISRLSLGFLDSVLRGKPIPPAPGKREGVLGHRSK